jgi:hypothetical protein
MAKILLGIALAVLIATGALGYMTKEKIVILQDTLKKTDNTLTATKGTLKKTQGELETRTGELATANAKIDENTKEIAAQKGKIDDLDGQLKTTKAELEAQTTKVAALQAAVDKLKSPTGEPVDPEELKRKIEELTQNLTKAQNEVAESKQLIESISQQKKAVELKVTQLERYKAERDTTISRPGLTGRIVAVNPGWNFLVLNVGDKQAVVKDAPMLVVRDGQPIAKARITSVEPTQSIADVIPGSVTKGVTVQPGDSVIFTGRTSATEPTVGAPLPALPH